MKQCLGSVPPTTSRRALLDTSFSQGVAGRGSRDIHSVNRRADGLTCPLSAVATAIQAVDESIPSAS
jgi:hypothetical protein